MTIVIQRLRRTTPAATQPVVRFQPESRGGRHGVAVYEDGNWVGFGGSQSAAEAIYSLYKAAKR